MPKIIINKQLLRRLKNNPDLFIYCLEGTEHPIDAIELYDLVVKQKIIPDEGKENLLIRIKNHQYIDNLN